jgi:hypothetical protein
MRHTTSTALRALLGAATFGAVISAAATASADPRTHDGFFLGLDIGAGYLSSSAEAAGTKVTYSGVTIPSAVLLGGTIGPVVIGGGFSWDYAFSPSAEIESGGVVQSGELNDVTLTLIGIGMFADIYPDPTSGLHFQPFIGWGGLDATYQGNSGGSDPTGLVTAIGVGYEFWVADEWSIGPMGRFTYAPLSLNNVDYNTMAFAALATFTYH